MGKGLVKAISWFRTNKKKSTFPICFRVEQQGNQGETKAFRRLHIRKDDLGVKMEESLINKFWSCIVNDGTFEVLVEPGMYLCM